MAESSAAVGASFLAAAHARAGQEKSKSAALLHDHPNLCGAALAAARRAARAGADPRHFRRLPRPTQRALWRGAQVWRRSAHQQKVSSEGRGRRQQRRGGTRPASCEQLVRWPTLKSLRKPRSGRLASASARRSRPRRGHQAYSERCRLQNGGCGSAFHAPLFSNSKAGNKTTPQLTTATWQCFVR